MQDPALRPFRSTPEQRERDKHAPNGLTATHEARRRPECIKRLNREVWSTIGKGDSVFSARRAKRLKRVVAASIWPGCAGGPAKQASFPFPVILNPSSETRPINRIPLLRQGCCCGARGRPFASGGKVCSRPSDQNEHAWSVAMRHHAVAMGSRDLFEARQTGRLLWHVGRRYPARLLTRLVAGLCGTDDADRIPFRGLNAEFARLCGTPRHIATGAASRLIMVKRHEFPPCADSAG